MKNDIRTHEGALEKCVKHPENIGWDKRDMLAIISEVRLFKKDNTNQDKECDIIALYDEPHNYSRLAEFKSDKAYPSIKAYNQLINTGRRFCDRIGYPAEEMIVVYYPSMRIETI